MKTQLELRTERPGGWPAWLLTLIALVGLLGLANAQDGALADADPRIVDLAHGPDRTPTPAMGTVPVPVRITDDGRHGDERTLTTQLIFALECDRPRSITVAVYNERGQTMQQAVLQARPGRNAMAMDVAHLREGRYVALLHEGANARVVRFQR